MGQSYRDLIAWQKAMDFDMDVYRTSKAFPLVEVETQLPRTSRTLVRSMENISSIRQPSWGKY